MPTYDYKCDACGHEFERFQSIMAEPIKKCPTCGKNKVRRLIGPGAGLIFKGSGFYITDYRSEGYKNAAKNESGGGSSTEAPSSSPSDSSSSDSPSKPSTESKPAATTASEAKPKSSGEGKSAKKK